MKVQLTQGKHATIDPQDYRLIAPHKWHAFKIGVHGEWASRDEVA